jgi:uncharacterized protein
MRGVMFLRARHCPFGVLRVVSEEGAACADEIFDFFVTNGITRLAFLPRVERDSWIAPELYARFMTRIFDLWLERDDPDFHIREFENIVHELLGGRAELCEFNGCCGSYLAVDSNGDVYLCDLFIGSDSMRVGNLLRESLSDILDSDSTLAKVNLKCDVSEECWRCSFFKICKGGCLYRRCLVRGMPSDKDLLCEFRQRLVSHVSTRLSQVLARADQEPKAIGVT